jgi:membrane-bound metal-dependent hydrolase YbcI (DUF457 family)
MVIASLIVVSEVVKQIIGWVNYATGTSDSLFFIPLHICSVLVFAIPLSAFTKKTSFLSPIFYALAMITAVESSMAMYIAPQQIISQSTSHIFRAGAEYGDYHTLIFHSFAAMFIMLVVAFKLYQPKFKDLIFGGLLYSGFMLISAILANLLDTNYARFLNFGGVGPFDQLRDISMFLFSSVIWILYVVVIGISGTITYYVPKLYSFVKAKFINKPENDLSEEVI